MLSLMEPQVFLGRYIQFLDESIGINVRSKCRQLQEPSWTPVVKTRKNAVVEYLDYQIPVTQLKGPTGNGDILLNVDALRAVQASGPNDTKHVLVTRGPIFISGKYGSREGRTNKDRKNID